MMNTRTSRAPTRTASGSASHSETGRLREIRYQRRTIGPSVSAICTAARQVEGTWYAAIACFHFSTPEGPPCGRSRVRPGSVLTAFILRVSMKEAVAGATPPFDHTYRRNAPGLPVLGDRNLGGPACPARLQPRSALERPRHAPSRGTGGNHGELHSTHA